MLGRHSIILNNCVQDWNISQML